METSAFLIQISAFKIQIWAFIENTDISNRDICIWNADITIYESDCFQIERKAMIRNRYIYLTSSVKNINGKEGRTLKQRHHNQNTTNRKPKGQNLSKINGQMAIKNETFH